MPYVQVNWSQYVEAMTPDCDFGWDTHIYNFELLQDQHCPIFDRAFSALLDDLHERGLLDDDAGGGMGEFGRTPQDQQPRRPRPLAAVLLLDLGRRRRAAGPRHRRQRPARRRSPSPSRSRR